MVQLTPRGTTRVLRSEGGESENRLRVFVAESSASDLFWLEMVFKSSRLPYIIEVATDVQAAEQYLEQHWESSQPDLILLDTLEMIEKLPGIARARYFVLTNSAQEAEDQRCIEKPFTQQKLLDCLSAAALDSWAMRLSGKTPSLAMAG